jgi:hypothetical protein
MARSEPTSRGFSARSEDKALSHGKAIGFGNFGSRMDGLESRVLALTLDCNSAVICEREAEAIQENVGAVRLLDSRVASLLAMTDSV